MSTMKEILNSLKVEDIAGVYAAPVGNKGKYQTYLALHNGFCITLRKSGQFNGVANMHVNPKALLSHNTNTFGREVYFNFGVKPMNNDHFVITFPVKRLA